METEIGHPPAGSVGRGLSKEQWLLPALLSGKKSAPSALALMSDNSVLSHLPLAHFKLQSQHCRSEWVNLNKSEGGTFKRNTGDSRSSLFHSAPVPTGFHSQRLWGLLFLALEPWAGDSGVGLRILTPHGWLPRLRYTSQVLTTARGCGTSLFGVSASLTSLDMTPSLYP